MNVIFVYGTLQTGERNHNLLKNSKSLGEYDLDGYTLYELGSFPAIVKDKKGRVRGEAYLVDDETLKNINEFEGEGYIYDLTYVILSDSSKPSIAAQAYVFNRSVVGRNAVPYERLPWKEKSFSNA